MSGKREIAYVAALAVLATALAAVLLLDAWGLRIWGAEVDYTKFGTWSDAASGIATFAAFVAAAVAIFAERQDRRQEARDKETAVFFWFSPRIAEPKPGTQVYLWDVVIENTTAAPILRWKLAITGHPDIELCGHSKRPLLPKEGWNTFNLPSLDGTLPSAMPQGTLTFVDKSNKVWTRNILGDLKPSKEPKVCPHDTLNSTA